MPKKKWTAAELEELINDQYDGRVSVYNLPKDVYNATVDTLTDAILNGFGFGEDDEGRYKRGENPERDNLFANFEHNIGAFSAAKTFQQTLDIQKLLFDSEGNKRPFHEFEKDAKKVFGEYNRNWLRTEYRTAHNNALAARQWLDFQDDKDIFPLLMYVTVGDQRVRKDHEELDGIVKHVDDPFWKIHFPPNDWNCRCTVTAHMEGEVKKTPAKDTKDIPEPPKLFRLNPAVDKVIFDPKDHPYFKVEDRYKVEAANNFGMPVKPLPPPLPKETPKLAQRLPFSEHLERTKKKLEEVTGGHPAIALEQELAVYEKAAIEAVKTNNATYKGYKRGQITFKELEEETARCNRIIDSYTLKKKAVSIEVEKHAEAVMSVLAQDEPLGLQIPFKGNGPTARKVEKGIEYFRRIVGKKDIFNNPPAFKLSKSASLRSYVSPGKSTATTFTEVNLRSGVDYGTLLHELGHWFELSNTATARVNKQFFDRRTLGLKPRSLSSIYPEKKYSFSEKAIEDDFINAYTGKICGEGSYETLTMWFSHMLGGPTSMRNFIQKDPDHFETYLKLFYNER